MKKIMKEKSDIPETELLSQREEVAIIMAKFGTNAMVFNSDSTWESPRVFEHVKALVSFVKTLSQ